MTQSPERCVCVSVCVSPLIHPFIQNIDRTIKEVQLTIKGKVRKCYFIPHFHSKWNSQTLTCFYQETLLTGAELSCHCTAGLGGGTPAHFCPSKPTSGFFPYRADVSLWVPTVFVWEAEEESISCWEVENLSLICGATFLKKPAYGRDEGMALNWGDLECLLGTIPENCKKSGVLPPPYPTLGRWAVYLSSRNFRFCICRKEDSASEDLLRGLIELLQRWALHQEK